MTEQVMELVQALGGACQDEDVLRMLCAGACRTLDQRLRPELTPEDCDLLEEIDELMEQGTYRQGQFGHTKQ